MRTPSEIRATGAAWVTEPEFDWLCSTAESVTGRKATEAGLCREMAAIKIARWREVLDLDTEQGLVTAVSELLLDHEQTKHVRDRFAEALHAIDNYADGEPFDPKRPYFADVRKIARDALQGQNSQEPAE